MSLIRRIWWPIYAAETNEELFKYTLKHMLVYVIFLTIVSTIVLAMIPRLRFTYSEALRKQFVREKFYTNDENIINFYEIKNMHEFWLFMEKIICVYLYNDYWYSYHDQIKEASADAKKLFYQNKILGVPRLRQVRVRNDSCVVHYMFKKSFEGCYGPYNSGNEDKSTFGLRQKPAWYFSEPEVYFSHSGLIASYGAGGYYQDLGTNRKQTEAILKNLKDNLWIGRKTRAVFLDFTLFNGNVNLFCIVKFVFEFPPTGGIVPTAFFYPADLVRYIDKLDYVILFLEAVVAVFIIYYTVGEIIAMYYLQKFYFFQCWNYVEIFILISLYVTYAFGIFRHFYITKQIDYINAHPDIYVSYESVGMVHRHVNNLLGITLFILWIKIFKFLKLSRTLGQLNNTLSRCVRDILGFSAMFFLIFFAFAQVGYILFGGDVAKFHSLSESLMTLLLTILGEFQYYSVAYHHRILAPIFFITYIFLVFFILVNMFLAIITDTYSQVKEEINLKKMDLQLDDYVLTNTIGRWIKSSKRVFPGTDIIEKVRTVLKMCNFSYTEIQAFFSFHNFRDDKEITREDIDKLLTSIKQALDENRYAPTDKKKDDRITLEAFVSQQEKIELLELQVETIRQNISEILIKKLPELGVIEDDED